MFRTAECSLVPPQAVPKRDIHGGKLSCPEHQQPLTVIPTCALVFLQVDSSSAHPSSLMHTEPAQDKEDHIK